VLVSVFAIGGTLIGMNEGLQAFRTIPAKQMDMEHLPEGVVIEKRGFDQPVRLSDEKGNTTQTLDGANFWLLNALGSRELPDGKYLYNPQTRALEVQWIQGIGSEKAAAPQARLMATVISGILNRRLPWGLVLLGVFLVIAVELLGIRSLSFAVGFYIPMATTLAIFVGGVVRWLVERSATRAGEATAESEVSPGSLFASGLIAAGGVVGLLGIGIKLIENTGKIPENSINFVDRFHITFLNYGVIAVLTFAALAYSLFHFARKPLEGVEVKKAESTRF